ncbi:MAG TPA: A24 family peptidase [Phycisphaerae bacterium]|nr:A24 family peptidase [Phycisphaerae bacterium]HNU43769.1 A24 family peptidase [Phycisphaerae bacterium]
MEPFWLVTLLVLVPGVLWASWIDYRERRVPNWLNAALIVSGFAVQAHFWGTAGLVNGAWGLLAGFGLLIFPWLMHGMGAGDVKLLAAIGVWVGPMLVFWSFLVGALLGGVAAVVMILASGRLHLACANLGIILNKCMNRRLWFTEYGSVASLGTTTQKLPYGVPLTAGTLIVLAVHLFGG